MKKATELGISQVIPLVCDRTERQHFRYERMNGILVSAMLQSQQSWLTEMSEPQQLRDFLKSARYDQRFIAHCINDENKRDLPSMNKPGSRLVLIGPEGDFTPDEISLATTNGFIAVSLGNTRLRTETAGMVAAVLIR